MKTDEEKGDYIAETNEAMEMLGKGYEPAAIIEYPRSQVVLRDELGEEWTVAWVKLSTAFKPHIKELRGSPLAIWLYIALSINKKGVAFPGIRTIAEETGYSHQGVLDAISTLEKKGYLNVRRGERRFNLYEPEFAAIGKVNEPSGSVNSVDSSKSLNESTFSPNESSPLDLNKRNKRNKIHPAKGKNLDTFMEFEKLKEKGRNGINDWMHRDEFPEPLLELADKCVERFGEPSNKDLVGWILEIGSWQSAGCSLIDWEAATKIVSKYTTPVLSVHGMTKAIKFAAQERRNGKHSIAEISVRTL